MINKRKASWRFTAVWTFPGNMVATISTDPIVLQNEMRQMETEMKRLVLQAQRCASYIRNIQLKYNNNFNNNFDLLSFQSKNEMSSLKRYTFGNYYYRAPSACKQNVARRKINSLLLVIFMYECRWLGWISFQAS